MRFASASEIRALDAAANAAVRLPGPAPEDGAPPLMRLAALALADTVEGLAARLPTRPEVIAVAGGGDNGADAALAASLLAERGFRTSVLRVSDATSWTDAPSACVPACAIVLDGILGIGLHGVPRPDAAAAIGWINRAHDKRGALVVAVDLPSGIEADTGAVPGAAVHADFTVTMGLPKRAFAQLSVLPLCGEIVLAPLPYPPSSEVPASPPSGAISSLFTALDLRRSLPPRSWAAHKGDFGRVALFVGSARYSGAGSLAVHGALRGGAGLVSAHVPQALVPALAAQAPEAMVRGYDAPSLSPEVLASLGTDLAGAVVAVGCGLSLAPGVADGVRWLLSTPGVRTFVLDADALSVLSPLPSGAAGSGPGDSVAGSVPSILTPHPGEAARLLGTTAAAVQADRPAAALALAARSGATVILKGAGSLVATPGRDLTLVAAGNPGLARGGSGDLLCGLCAALLARGLPPHEAACAAAFLHGRAADLAALRRTQEGLLPTDLLDELWSLP